MRVKVELDKSRTEPEAVIYTASVTDEVRIAERMLRDETLQGYRNGEVILLQQCEILRIYAENQKVFAQTSSCICQLRARLYTLEEQLDKRIFLRISNSEIVNVHAIKRLDISIAGTIGLELYGGIRTYVSRRYIKRIREYLEL